MKLYRLTKSRALNSNFWVPRQDSRGISEANFWMSKWKFWSRNRKSGKVTLHPEIKKVISQILRKLDRWLSGDAKIVTRQNRLLFMKFHQKSRSQGSFQCSKSIFLPLQNIRGINIENGYHFINKAQFVAVFFWKRVLPRECDLTEQHQKRFCRASCIKSIRIAFHNTALIFQEPC